MSQAALCCTSACSAWWHIATCLTSNLSLFFLFIYLFLVLTIVNSTQMEQIAMAYWDEVPLRPVQRFGLSTAGTFASQLRSLPSIFHDVYPDLCPLGKDQGNTH